MKYNLLIKQGFIVDGTGADAYIGDIAVKDGKIAAIGDLKDAEADNVIDASGKYVTPGFIDPHSHADLSLLVWPENEAYVMQGVTTQICGNCGLAPAPIGGEFWEFFCWEYKSMNHAYKTVFEMYNFQTDKNAMLKALEEDYGLSITWSTLGEFMEAAEKKGFSCNYYPMSGHNHIRNVVMGKEYRPATEEEIEKMKQILRDDLEHGSQGFSTGLDYLPGRFAEIEEIEELLKVVSEYNGVYNTHVRGFDPKCPQQLNQLYGVEEATELCRRTGVKTNISHMVPLFTVTPAGSTDMEQKVAAASVKELEKGWREEHLPMMYDVISNPSCGGSTIPYLAQMVRPWVLMCGSVERFIEMTECADFLQTVREQANTKYLLLQQEGPHIDFVIKSCRNTGYNGKTLAEIKAEYSLKDNLDVVLKILKEDPYTKMDMRVNGGEHSVHILLESERAMPSSDGFAFNLDTQMDYPAPLNRLPHPNNFCYAIRYLLHYGPKRFEDKIKQMTSVPAQWFNIPDRGILAEGNWSDIVVIDRDALNPGEGNCAPDGIEYVIINGTVTADHKRHTGALTGKVLRKERTHV